MTDHTPPGEVHSSPVPLMFGLGFALTLASLLIWPIAIIALPLTLYSVFLWVKEDVAMWEFREVDETEKTGDASWAMVWLIITEVIIFGGFFAFWFWAKWHTLEWDGAIAGATWGIEHEIGMVGIATAILISSGVLAHMALHARDGGDTGKATNLLFGAVGLGLVFLVLQGMEYAKFFQDGHIPSSSGYWTAFYSLTGLHGLHVLGGIVALGTVALLTKKGLYEKRRDSFQAVVWYWHFVDVVWVLLFFIVYMEVI